MFLSREQARALDLKASKLWGVPSLLLMENAGRGVADVLQSLKAAGPVLICCGKGNNGGDGLVLARHLLVRKISAEVVLFARSVDELSPDAKVHWDIVRNLNIPALMVFNECEDALKQRLFRAEWVVDALFGTGFTGEVRAPFDRVIQLINASSTRILALDIPSGLDADTGEPAELTVKAHHTVTFAAPKIGFSRLSAANYVGQVHVADIGVPVTA